jgi:hypothetical protein
MENNDLFLDQLQQLIGSGSDKNIELAFQIAEGLDLTEKVIQPWRDLWSMSCHHYRRTAKSDLEIIRIITSSGYLSLKGSNLCEIPSLLNYIRELHELDLSDNTISHIPETMVSLYNLMILDLSNNKLNEVPEILHSMQQLSCLNLGKNQLYKMDSIPQNLTVLNISENKFKSTPDFLFKKNNLMALDITGNPGFVWDLSELDIRKLEYLTFGGTEISKLKNHDYHRVSWWNDESGSQIRLFGSVDKNNYRFSPGVEDRMEFPDCDFPEFFMWGYSIEFESSYAFSDYLEESAIRNSGRFRYRA